MAKETTLDSSEPRLDITKSTTFGNMKMTRSISASLMQQAIMIQSTFILRKNTLVKLFLTLEFQ